jgi:DNA polymerase-4
MVRRLDPSLEGRAVAVMRDGKAADLSWEIRSKGISVGIRRGNLLALCPEAALVPFERERGEEVQRDLMDIYARHVPAVEPLSLTETFLDVGGLSPAPFPDIGRQVQVELGIVVSFGLGPTKLVARAAGLELAGKNSQGPIPPRSGEVLAIRDSPSFLAPLPVAYLYALPEEVPARLARQGFSTIGQVRGLSLEELARQFGWPLARRVAAAAAGGEPDPVRPLWPPPSLRLSRSFEGGLNDSGALARFLDEAAERLAREMADNGLACGEVALVFLGEGGRQDEATRRLTRPTRSRGALACGFKGLAERLLAAWGGGGAGSPASEPEAVDPPVGVEVRAGRVGPRRAQQLDFSHLFAPPVLGRVPGRDSEDVRAAVRELAWRFGRGVVQGRPVAGGEGAGEAGSGGRSRRESLLAFYDPLRAQAQAHVKTH